MRRLSCALLALTALAGTAHSQAVIRAPFVTVQTGDVVWVRAPFVNLVIPVQRRALPMAPAVTSTNLVPTVDVPPGVTAPKVVLPSTDLTPVPAPTGPSSLFVRPWTLPEFAHDFKPAPGKYEVVLIHPVTCCPVKVCFCLPDACVKTVRLHDRQVTFHYGLARNVVLHFNPDGSVNVRD